MSATRREPGTWVRTALVGGALVLVTAAVYARSCANGFVISFDDDLYVLSNPHVQAGLNLADVAWAFTTGHAANWHPLTWLSLQLDNQLYGLAPWGYHLTNVLLHSANVLLLFWVLTRMTGALGRSAAVAACFALHPLHVESVAWVAERKDALSTLFWMLTLGAYLRYTERPNPARYAIVVVAFALGLLAKPMLVTLPFVLLLLDYWPLGRLRAAPASQARKAAPPRRLNSQVASRIVEKLPLFFLAAVSCAITVVAQDAAGTVRSLRSIPVGTRCLNALVAWVVYLRKTVWPTDLAAFYPHAYTVWLPLEAAGAAVLLLAITLFAYRQRSRHPYLIVGWLWYVGTLVPVIGLVQVGDQALADRYTYLPHVGLFIALAWGLPDLLGSSRYRVPALAGTLTAALIAWAYFTWVQIGFWHDGFRLWEHALAVGEESYLAHNNLGTDYLRRGEPGDLEKAAEHFMAATELRPNHLQAQANLGNTLSQLGRLDEAASHLRMALQLDPTLEWVHYLLGAVLERQGKFDDAAEKYIDSIRLKPASVQYHDALGRVLARQGKLQQAVEAYTAAVRLEPDPAEGYYRRAGVLARMGKWEPALALYRHALEIAPEEVRYHCDLGLLLQEHGREAEARAEYRAALERDPRWPLTFSRAAWQLATSPHAGARNGRRAVELAQEACQGLEDPPPEYLDVLAAAFAEAGRFAEAAATARRALEQAAAAGKAGRAEAIRARLRLYEASRPYRVS